MLIFEQGWLYVLLSVLVSLVAVSFNCDTINMLQLNNYKISKAIFKPLKSNLPLYVLLTIAGIVFSIINIYSEVFLGIFLIVQVVATAVNARRARKTKLVLTHRAVRLLTISAICNVACGMFVPYCVVIVYSMLATLIALYALAPFEILNNNRYIRKAELKLKSRGDLINIGITGSFGKTSIKNILQHLLKCKYNVLATPSSYNTELGIALTVNNKLTKDTQVFIAEMGARRVGDIAKLCKIVKPTVAIVSGIGAAHLDTFGSVDNIVKAKGELLEALSSDSFAVLNCQDKYCRQMAQMCSATVYTAALDCGEVYASDISICGDGTFFTLNYKDVKYNCKTALLGRHNVENIVLASLTAIKLGVEIAQIVEQIATLTQIPHRLQLIKGEGITIIDDSYNANEVGLCEGLEVLKSLIGRKIVITCGMVELGEYQREANYKYGQQLGNVADVIIANGINSQAIVDGANCRSNGNAIYKVESLKDSMQILSSIRRYGDIVMFSNDLPDNM